MLADWGDGPEDYGRMGIPAWREAYGDDTDSGGKKKSQPKHPGRPSMTKRH